MNFVSLGCSLLEGVYNRLLEAALYSPRSHEVKFWLRQCFALRGAKRKRRISVGKYLHTKQGAGSGKPKTTYY
jgi:hypothetical protein